jgi:hypothetical protein
MEGNLPFLVKIPSDFFQLGGGGNGWWEENHIPTPINKNSITAINRYVYIP